MLEAQACAKAGRADAALQAIEEALAIAKDTGERWAMPEILRVKAGLLLTTDRNEDQIGSLLINSLEIARRSQARCWELRTACDLAQLWQSNGRGKEALLLLQPIYEQFTEGLDTPDLQNAKLMIGSLRAEAKTRCPEKYPGSERPSTASAPKLLTMPRRSRTRRPVYSRVASS